MKRFTVIFALSLLTASFPLATTGQERELLGDWVGWFKLNEHPVFVRVHFERSATGPKGTLDIPFERARGLALTEIRSDSDLAHFELPQPGAGLIFDGEFADGRISGQVQGADDRGRFELVRVAKVDAELLQHYTGVYQLGPQRFFYLQPWVELENQLVYVDESGRIRGLYPTSASTFFAGPGLLLPSPTEMNFSFVRNKQGEVTHVVWQEHGSAETEAKKVKLYNEEVVTFRNGDVTLAGVLLTPRTRGPHPAMVLIHGSGPQDRFSLLPFVHYLVRRGIALLGYDKRGVGASTGDWRQSSFEDLAGDVLAAVEFLKARNDINPKQIGVLGVSQGGWIGPLAASRSKDIAFVISVAGPGVSPAEQGLDLLENGMRAEGFSEDEIREAVALAKLRDDFLRTGEGWEQLQTAAAQAQKQAWFRYVGVPPKQEAEGWIRFFRPILDYDPIPALEQLRSPVLALFGGLDLVVPGEKNKQKWEASLNRGANKDYTLVVLPKGNHLLLASETGALSEFPRLKTFVPEFFETLVNWVVERVDVPETLREGLTSTER